MKQNNKGSVKNTVKIKYLWTKNCPCLEFCWLNFQNNDKKVYVDSHLAKKT